MRRPLAAFGFLAILTGAALSLTVLPNGETQAASQAPATFVVPANDGYGVAGCLLNGGDCGKIVANAWCEAHGYGRAETFGIAADALASTTPVRVSGEADRPVTITCAN
jgi:hypothetical protein